MPSPTYCYPAVSQGLEELEQAERAPLTHRTHLHGACLLIRTSLGCHLKAVCHPLLRGPVGGCQLLHEVLQADDSMVGLEGLQLEVLLVGHMDLQEKWGKAGVEGPPLSILVAASKTSIKTIYSRTSLVVQWIRTRLPMQGIWVQSLVQEDSTCHRATKLCAPLLSPHSRAREPRLLKPVHFRAQETQLLSLCATTNEALTP